MDMENKETKLFKYSKEKDLEDTLSLSDLQIKETSVKSPTISDKIETPISRIRSRSTGAYGSPLIQKVNNITVLSSLSAKSRRIMFMFGLVQYKPEMELSAIKQRQVRCSQMTLPAGEEMRMAPEMESPASDGGVTPVASRKKTKKGGPTGKIKALWRRPHMPNVLAKSFSCFPVRKHNRALPEHSNIPWDFE